MSLLVYAGAHPPAFPKEDLKDVIIFPKHQSASQTYIISANLQTYVIFLGMAGFRNSPCNSFLTYVSVCQWLKTFLIRNDFSKCINNT